MTREIQPREYIDEGASREEQLIFPGRGAIGKLRDRDPNSNGAKTFDRCIAASKRNTCRYVTND